MTLTWSFCQASDGMVMKKQSWKPSVTCIQHLICSVWPASHMCSLKRSWCVLHQLVLFWVLAGTMLSSSIKLGYREIRAGRHFEGCFFHIGWDNGNILYPGFRFLPCPVARISFLLLELFRCWSMLNVTAEWLLNKNVPFLIIFVIHRLALLLLLPANRYLQPNDVFRYGFWIGSDFFDTIFVRLPEEDDILFFPFSWYALYIAYGIDAWSDDLRARWPRTRQRNHNHVVFRNLDIFFDLWSNLRKCIHGSSCLLRVMYFPRSS